MPMDPKPRRVQFPLFELASNPTIKLADIQERFRLMSGPCEECGLPFSLESPRCDTHLVTFIMER